MIIPAIDLIDGRVVRLNQGDYDRRQDYDYSPLQQLQSYQQQGAELLHIVDLSGAKDPQQRQLSLLTELLGQLAIPVQVGGGVRTTQDVENLLNAGASRVVVGSTAINQPELVVQWFKQFGPQSIVLALDVRINLQGQCYIATHGWQQASSQTLQQTIEQYKTVGLQHVLCTDIARDGMLTGCNTELYQQINQDYPDIVLQASGGIGCLDDIKQTQQSGAAGVIVGKALLEGQFTLPEAIACWQNA